MLLRRQLLDLRERVAIQPVRFAESLREQLQPCSSIVVRQSWLFRGRSRGCSGTLHIVQPSVKAGRNNNRRDVQSARGSSDRRGRDNAAPVNPSASRLRPVDRKSAATTGSQRPSRLANSSCN